MVKIEKLLDGAAVSIVRDGVEVTLLEGQMFHEYLLNTLKVHSGRVVYSINEEQVVEVAAPVAKVESVVPKPVVTKPRTKAVAA